MIYTQCIRSLTMSYASIIAGKVSLKIEPWLISVVYSIPYASSFRLASKRLSVVQTEFGQNIGFSMRTFRFTVAGSDATDEQQQTISCDLHLEPAELVSSTQPSDCSCHTEADCAAPGKWEFEIQYYIKRILKKVYTNAHIGPKIPYATYGCTNGYYIRPYYWLNNFQAFYCIEIRSAGNLGDDLLLLRNDQGQR